MNSKEALALEIFKVAHLTGDFLLRSGQRSDEYFDKYRFESDPQVLRKIAELLGTLIPKDVDFLAGLEMGGIPIATALSLHTGIPTVFVRKKAKQYGTCQFAEGRAIEGKRLCIIEDVVTTGGQVVESARDLRLSGAIVDHVLCVIHRGTNPVPAFVENKLQLQSLLTMDYIKEVVARERA